MFPDWQVGDLVTHGGGDVHVVIWTDSDNGSLPDELEVRCVWPSTDGSCEKGDRERNVVWAFYLVKRHLRFLEPEPVRKRA